MTEKELDLQKKLADLCVELNTQDNRITQHPLFIVEVEKRIYGMDPEWVDDLDYIWVYTEDSEYSYEPEEIIEAIRDQCEDMGHSGLEIGTLNLHDCEIEPEEWGYHQMFYVTEVEFKCAHLTERAADLYIAQNNHNLRKPRVYVTSQYRCYEWNMVREHLMVNPQPYIHKLELEIEMLRRYGNKDCTAQAEEALAALLISH